MVVSEKSEICLSLGLAWKDNELKQKHTVAMTLSKGEKGYCFSQQINSVTSKWGTAMTNSFFYGVGEDYEKKNSSVALNLN